MEDPDLGLFFKECRLSGYEVVTKHAEKANGRAGILVVSPISHSLVVIRGRKEGVWETWGTDLLGLRWLMDEREFDNVEEAIEDLDRRLKELEDGE
jgi:hypothetical protein